MQSTCRAHTIHNQHMPRMCLAQVLALRGARFEGPLGVVSAAYA